jgi:hypothetical protein
VEHERQRKTGGGVAGGQRVGLWRPILPTHWRRRRRRRTHALVATVNKAYPNGHHLIWSGTP